MASIKFLVQSQKETAPIYCRLSLSRSESYKRKTGLFSNSKEMESMGKAKTKLDAKQKNLQNELERLSGAIRNKINEGSANGLLIDGFWLEKTIEEYFGRTKTQDLEYLTNYTQHFIDNLGSNVSLRSEGIITPATATKYTTIHKKLLEFEKATKKRYLVSEVDLNFRKHFITFLTTATAKEVSEGKRVISHATAGRYIKFVKTFVLDAQKHGMDISPQMRDFKGYSIKADTITLSFDELDILRNTRFESEKLEAAKDWLIIGCYLGQRVSDLLRMNKQMIHSTKGFELIQLTQQKTGKTVQIPIHPIVREVLDKRKGEFPEALGHTKDSRSALFNRSIKDVCKAVGFNSMESGKVYDSELKKYVHGQFEKWKLVTSHICRRSFATNFYANQNYPTPILMNITAHSTEKQFLEYIGKPPLDFSLQLAKTWANQALEQKKETQMTIVRTGSN